MSRPDLLGPALRRLRLERHERQEEVARRAGFPSSMLSNYERGKHRPRARNLAALQQALEADQATLHQTIERVSPPSASWPSTPPAWSRWPPMFDRLGETLTVLRVLLGWTQAKLAQRAGIRATQVSRYKTGQVQPQLTQLERLLNAMGVDLPAFLFALLHVERTVRLIEQADHLPAETIVRDAVSAHWARVTDLHLSVAKAVAEVIASLRRRIDASCCAGFSPRSRSALRAPSRFVGLVTLCASQRRG